jgi:hypothetical protein
MLFKSLGRPVKKPFYTAYTAAAEHRMMKIKLAQMQRCGLAARTEKRPLDKKRENPCRNGFRRMEKSAVTDYAESMGCMKPCRQ